MCFRFPYRTLQTERTLRTAFAFVLAHVTGKGCDMTGAAVGSV